MAVEIAGFEMVQGPIENGVEGGKSVAHEKENGKLEQDLGAGEAIKFGSHGDESAKGEADDVADSNTPKNAAEEWPAPKQIHSFYFVRCRPYDDPSIKTKIDLLDKEISKKNQARFQITEALKAKRSERSELISQIKILRGDSKQFQSIFDEKMKEIEPLQQALGKMRNNRSGICSSEEELNDVIYSLQYRIQHESIPLSEEKQILREIKQLEGTREKVIANAAIRTKLQDTIGQKDAIQDQVKLIGGDLDGVKKERQAIRSKIIKIDDELKTIDTAIQSLQEELGGVTQKREQTFESIQKLRKQRDEGNSYFYQSRTLLTKARDLAAKKEVAALDELSQKEVEKFMSLWNGGKAFRDDYEKRILSSLDMRLLSRDGRMRNPDEKPLLEEPKVAVAEALPKAIAKQPKEEPKPSPVETLATQKETKTKGRDSKTKSDNDDYEFENPHKETPAAKEPDIDPAKAKELKREEEIAKAKLASERKKKLAEKAAVKAALKAQKEAEKKLKDREKKAKKKSGAVTTQEEQEAAEVEATEPEKVNDVVEAPAPVKEKATKESSIRSRSRAKGPESIPKAILKRKKSNNYLIWIAAEEEIISDQSKSIIKKSTNFCWPSIQNLNAAAHKEKCGWCFSCKVANDDRDCIYLSAVKPLYEVSTSTSVGPQPKIQNGHLREIICQIFSLEVRLRGLLSGPWLNLHQTNLWHEDLLKTSDLLSVKRLLLLLESNLRHQALSADWLKHVDSVVTMGSATHIVVGSSRTSSKHGIGKKRARHSDIESSSSSKTTGGLGMYWWRGGRLSRKLFNCKVLPRSFVTKAARQAGFTKIPGILYPENSDFAKRSRCVAWRAAVEMSTSVDQLALQVRELYSNIRWHDIENNHPLYVLDKESRKSSKLFKKAIVRRKLPDGQSVKYLLDFGKRRAIPDIITKHGSLLVEEPESERKKYWLNESYVPLRLVKNFEEKRIVRRSNNKKHGKIIGIDRVKRAPQQRGFSYLFSRMERSVCHQCEHCKRDVPIREAVSCIYCKGYFHKRHVKKSGGTTTECTYSCHRCQDGLQVETNTNGRKVGTKLPKIQSQNCKSDPLVCKSANVKGNKKASSKVRKVISQNNKIQSVVPLRRSTRKVKSMYSRNQMIGGYKKGMQSKKNVGRKKGKHGKSKKATSQKSKKTTGQRKTWEVTIAREKRSEHFSSYWLNGLWFSRKPNDERVMLFEAKKRTIPAVISGSFDYPKCRLCCGDESTSNYIACEKCGDWFHGDAFGLTEENASQLIGFKCHVCRGRDAPICPHVKINALSRIESNAAIERAEE